MTTRTIGSHLTKQQVIGGNGSDLHVLAGGSIATKGESAILEKAGVQSTKVTIDGSVSSTGAHVAAILGQGSNGDWTIGTGGEVSGNLGIYLDGTSQTLIVHGLLKAIGQSAGWFSAGKNSAFNDGTIQALNGVGLGTEGQSLDVTNNGVINANIGLYAGQGADLTLDNQLGGTITASNAALWAQGDSRLHLTNAGTIDAGTQWAALGGNGADTIINTGSITGYIDLKGGNDRFVQTAGIMIGWLFMGDGNDVFRQTGGTFKVPLVSAGYVAGGAGNDTYIFNNNVVLTIEKSDAGFDTIIVGRSYALELNIEKLVLTGTAISGFGNARANVLIGDDIANVLSGFEGKDRLNGGQGDDQLTGGLGHDTFVFGANFGHDTITDWVDGADKINLSHADTVSAFADLVISASGSDVSIVAGVNSILVLNADVTQFSAADFQF